MNAAGRPLVFGVALAGLVILLGGASDAQRRTSSRYPVMREDQVRWTMRFAGAADRVLEVSLVHGGMSVHGHDGDTVEVEVRRQVRAMTEADADAALDTDLAFSEAGGAARVLGNVSARPGCDSHTEGSWPRQPPYRVSFDVEVRVPRTAKLRLCTINDGDIRVEGVAGDFQVDNVNGAISLTDVRGAGHAVTVNGDVIASFSEVPRNTLLFRSVNGDLEAAFPRSLAAELWMKTFNGGLYTDFELSSIPSAPQAERRNGLSVYRANRMAGFRAGQGGPSFTFDAFNGDVRVIERR